MDAVPSEETREKLTLKNFLATLGVVIVIAYFAAMGFSLGTGFRDADQNKVKMCGQFGCYNTADPNRTLCKSNWKRIEYVVPGYRIGCWLGETPE